MKIPIKKAGAVILRNDNSHKIALIYRGSKDDWSFPKGHIESNETALEACTREVKEETGLDIEILTQLPNHEYIDIIYNQK